MMLKRRIEVRHRFEGYHRWADAPEEVAFLRNEHRHMFHVKLSINVKHDDRELEFIMVRSHLVSLITMRGAELGNSSCEMIADVILKAMLSKYGDRGMTCWVTEDGENGAVVEYIPE